MTRALRLGLFALVCIAQLTAAASGILRFERALGEGERYRFECAPVDPEDPFRGRYVALGFSAADTSLDLPGAGSAWAGGTRVFAVLGRDERGYAVVTRLSSTRPTQGDYLWVEAQTFGDRDGRVNTRLSFPFDRYFMEESAAKDTERAYREALRGGAGTETYAEVRVLGGLGVIESLVVDGVRIGGAR